MLETEKLDTTTPLPYEIDDSRMKKKNTTSAAAIRPVGMTPARVTGLPIGEDPRPPPPPLSYDAVHNGNKKRLLPPMLQLTNGQQPTTENRTSSTSPGRTAHFSNRLSVTDELHNPPPRSVSPYKSAMKQSSSPKPTLSSSEVSDVTSVGSADDRSKKPKVSFDDEAEVLPPPPPPPPPAPAPPPPAPAPAVPIIPKKKPWISLGKKNNNHNHNNDENNKPDDFDGMMMMKKKPRPALPSFGSVREKDYHSTTTTSTPMTENQSDTESLPENSNHSSHEKIRDGAKDSVQDATKNNAEEAMNGHAQISVSEDLPDHSPGENLPSANENKKKTTPKEPEQDQNSSSDNNQSDRKTQDDVKMNPSVEEEDDDFDQGLYKMPGGFPASYPPSAVSVPTDLAAQEQPVANEMPVDQASAKEKDEEKGDNTADNGSAHDEETVMESSLGQMQVGDTMTCDRKMGKGANSVKTGFREGLPTIRSSEGFTEQYRAAICSCRFTRRRIVRNGKNFS